MSDFSVYKQLETARIASNGQLANAAQPISQSHQRELNFQVANAAAALTEQQIAVAPYAANLAVSKATVALPFVANTTDYNVLTISKRTGNGAAVVMASANLANVAASGFIPIAFTVANAANAVCAAGDVITLTNAKTGNGVANVPALTVSLVFEDIA